MTNISLPVRYLFLICCCLVFGQISLAQDTVRIDEGLHYPVNLQDNLQAMVDSSHRVDATQIDEKIFATPAGIFHDDKIRANGKRDYWLRFSIHNTTASELDNYLFTGWHDKLYWYEKDVSGKYQLLQTAGMMMDPTGVRRWDNFAMPVQVPPGETRTFLLHIKNSFYVEAAFSPTLHNPLTYQNFKHREYVKYDSMTIIYNTMIGMLLALLCITIINYTQLPDRSSLFFAAYLLGLIFMYALRIEFRPFQLSYFHRWPMLKYYADIPAILFCFFIVHLLFGNSFLSLRERYPLMGKVFKIAAVLATVLLIITASCIYFDHFDIAANIFSYTYFSSFVPLVIVLIALTRRTKHHPLARFFILGSLCPYFVSVYSFLFLHHAPNVSALPELAPSPATLSAGVILQALFFAAGLSYRNKMLHQDKTKTQELLIKQLNKNKALQRKLNEQLEELVKEQTTEILRKKQELEEQRKLQMEMEYEKKFSEIELKAIRAQINPHFIFNCLNSIQLFVMQRDYEYAQKYLSDFSYLIRKTLDFSRRNFITLSDEIAYLNTYLGLEKMRFENKMEYQVLVENNIPISELEVPAMLLQPYVENAVKHGMNNEQQVTGMLYIRFHLLHNDILECIIEDNGIGIERSKAIRNLHSNHQSSGLEISHNRAEILNKMYNTGIQIEIIDKSSQESSCTGTLVRILIPQL